MTLKKTFVQKVALAFSSFLSILLPQTSVSSLLLCNRNALNSRLQFRISEQRSFTVISYDTIGVRRFNQCVSVLVEHSLSLK